MPPKPVERGGAKFRSIGFYPADDVNVEKIRAKLKRLDPSRRDVPITDVVRHALAIAAAREPSQKKD
jgi:hypothetical protein